MVVCGLNQQQVSGHTILSFFRTVCIQSKELFHFREEGDQIKIYPANFFSTKLSLDHDSSFKKSSTVIIWHFSDLTNPQAVS